MITRDSRGIPHVEGADVLEVAWEQGRATAHDRAWQLEVERRRAEGTSAELFGASAREWDVLARRALLPDVAQRAYAAVADESREFVDAYVAGVNDLLPASQRWQSWTPLGVFAVQHLLFSRFPSKLWQHHVRQVLGPAAADVLELLRTEGLPGGSNAVAVAGHLTASGMPLVAGDPHRVIEAPGCYAQVRLVCTDPADSFDVAGLSFVGVPGVQHFGHAVGAGSGVAWGVTNAVADDEDVFVEPEGWEPVERRVETIRVRRDDGELIAEEVEISVAEHGPVVVGEPGSANALSVRNPAWALGNLGFDTLLPLLRSRGAGDVVAAFRHWVSPVNNLVVADTEGRVAHHVVGRVPERDGVGEWVGWVDDLPRRAAADVGGVLVTANDRATSSFERIGDDFAPPHRAARIAQLVGDLAAQGSITPASLAAVLADDLQTAGESLLKLIGGLTELTDPAARLRDRLLAWDRRMTADSVEAALFVAVRAAAVERIANHPGLDGVDGSPYGDLFAPWFDLRARIRLALPALLRAETHESVHQNSRFGAPELTIRGAVEEVAAEVERSGDPAPWGSAHVAVPLTPEEQFGIEPPPGAAPPRLPVAGDDDCVVATRALGGVGACVHGPVARWVWDLAGESRWVVPLGASGDPASPYHHDQQTTWAAGGTLPLERPSIHQEAP